MHNIKEQEQKALTAEEECDIEIYIFLTGSFRLSRPTTYPGDMKRRLRDHFERIVYTHASASAMEKPIGLASPTVCPAEKKKFLNSSCTRSYSSS